MNWVKKSYKTEQMFAAVEARPGMLHNVENHIVVSHIVSVKRRKILYFNVSKAFSTSCACWQSPALIFALSFSIIQKREQIYAPRLFHFPRVSLVSGGFWVPRTCRSWWSAVGRIKRQKDVTETTGPVSCSEVYQRYATTRASSKKPLHHWHRWNLEMKYEALHRVPLPAST